MGMHILELTLPFGHSADLNACRRCHALVRAGLQELSHPNSTGIAGRPAGWKDMIGADGLVSVGDGSFLADKEGPKIDELICVRRLILNVKLQMLRSILIAQ